MKRILIKISLTLMILTGIVSVSMISHFKLAVKNTMAVPPVEVGLLCCHALPGECWYYDESEPGGYVIFPGQFITQT